MRWLLYFIFAYVLLGIQLGAGAFISYRDVSPNLLLLLVVFISLSAPREEALLGCFLIGALQDLIALQPVGLFAFSYGMVAILVTSMAEMVRRNHPLTHLTFTFIGGSVMGMLLIVHDYFRPAGPVDTVGGTVAHAIRIGPRVVGVSVIYTTLLAPVVIGLLQQTNRLFAFDVSNRRRGHV